MAYMDKFDYSGRVKKKEAFAADALKEEKYACLCFYRCCQKCGEMDFENLLVVKQKDSTLAFLHGQRFTIVCRECQKG